VNLQAVRCTLASEAGGATCAATPLPPSVILSLGRAEAAIEGAQQAGRVQRARSAVRSAVRLMGAAARGVRRAEAGRSIDAQCSKTLRKALRDARGRARRYLKNGPGPAAIPVRRLAPVS